LDRLVAVLEVDAAPLSSYAGVFGCLRAALANYIVVLAVGSRQQLQASLGRRFTEFSDPLVVLALWVDPFWAPVRSRLACLLWGDRSLEVLRDAAVAFLCGADATARSFLLAGLAGFFGGGPGPGIHGT